MNIIIAMIVINNINNDRDPAVWVWQWVNQWKWMRYF